jgi:hypothetical protein
MNPNSNVLPKVPPLSAANEAMEVRQLLLRAGRTQDEKSAPRQVSARALRQECAGKHTSRALALVLDRLEELESLLDAYESGRILVTGSRSSMSMQRDPADPIRELRGRVAAATDFIVNRFRDAPWSQLPVDQ